MTDWDRAREILRDIQRDSEADVERFEGQPFEGRVVADYMGCQAAMIQALARVVEQLVPVIETSVIDEHNLKSKTLLEVSDPQIHIAVVQPEAALDGVLFKLWSGKHQMWWRAGARGYTANEDEAGRFIESDALHYVLNSAYCGVLSDVTSVVVDVPGHRARPNQGVTTFDPEDQT